MIPQCGFAGYNAEVLSHERTCTFRSRAANFANHADPSVSIHAKEVLKAGGHVDAQGAAFQSSFQAENYPEAGKSREIHERGRGRRGTEAV